MSARQRHSRTTTSDGWTVISSSSKSKSKSKSKIKSNSTQNATTSTQSALLAHKSDLDDPLPSSSISTSTSSSNELNTSQKAELTSLQSRFTSLHSTFQTSTCCTAFKSLLDSHVPISTTSQKENETTILSLALSSLSLSTTSISHYQLSALLTLISHFSSSPASTSTSTEIETYAYDPIFTPIDTNLFSSYNITVIPPSTLSDLCSTDNKKPEEGISAIYIPHASLWLNHKYLKLRPRVWIGNDFDIYELNAVDDEVLEVLEDARGILKDYDKVGFPEAEKFGGGVVFNNMVVYVRRDDIPSSEGKDEIVNGAQDGDNKDDEIPNLAEDIGNLKVAEDGDEELMRDM